MSDPKDKKSDADDKSTTPGAEKTSGRVAFDSRGNPIWEWQTSTGVFGREVSTQRLKKLEAKDLAIVETPPAGQGADKPKGSKLELEEKAQASRATGFNPYDSSSAYGSKPKVADTPRKPVKDLRKLDQWIQLKKGLTDKDRKK